MHYPLVQFVVAPQQLKILKKVEARQKYTLEKIAIGLVSFDALAFITTLVIGILGATQVIAMPAATYSTLLGVSGGVASLWIIITIALIKQKMQSKPPIA